MNSGLVYYQICTYVRRSCAIYTELYFHICPILYAFPIVQQLALIAYIDQKFLLQQTSAAFHSWSSRYKALYCITTESGTSLLAENLYTNAYKKKHRFQGMNLRQHRHGLSPQRRQKISQAVGPNKKKKKMDQRFIFSYILLSTFKMTV